MAADGPQRSALEGLIYLSAFFQESTRTRLGFMSAAARQGASVLDAGSDDRFRIEPTADQQGVLGGLADIIGVRHWLIDYANQLARRGRCHVVNLGAGDRSHPTQSLVDLFVLTDAIGHSLADVRVVFVGSPLRSAHSFRQLAPAVGLSVSWIEVAPEPPWRERQRCEAELRSADVIYIQSLSDTKYDGPGLNHGPRGPALPQWSMDVIHSSTAFIMHALPRGPELPDDLMHSARSLVGLQVDLALPMRGAILRWLVEPT